MKDYLKKYECDGQLSIFDFLPPAEPEKKTELPGFRGGKIPASIESRIAQIARLEANESVSKEYIDKTRKEYGIPKNGEIIYFESGLTVYQAKVIECVEDKTDTYIKASAGGHEWQIRSKWFMTKEDAEKEVAKTWQGKIKYQPLPKSERPKNDFASNHWKIKHPDYGGSQDEIVRLSIENRFNLSIILKTCDCGSVPKGYFISNTEYWVQCECGRKTGIYKHMYEAKQWWNIGKLAANICPHSNHECNKKELWKIADGLDDTECPHVCCRKCATQNCGSRCNGSSEPPKVRLWHRLCKTKPETSGYYEIMDIDGKKGKAWYEAIRGDFDHVTGRQIECWREN